MIKTLLIDGKQSALQALEEKIGRYCSEISIQGKAETLAAAHQLVLEKQPDLLFIGLDMPSCRGVDVLYRLPPLDCEFIVVTPRAEFALDAIKCCASGYVLRPVEAGELSCAVRNAKKRIALRQEARRHQQVINDMRLRQSANDLIGVPAMDGLDFISAREIIRCEGMQKCTRIITREKSNTVSSYNLGEYRRILEPYGFFSPHKSHLINLRCIRKYRREGSIIMTDGSAVPVSKRRKCAFLQAVNHL